MQVATGVNNLWIQSLSKLIKVQLDSQAGETKQTPLLVTNQFMHLKISSTGSVSPKPPSLTMTLWHQTNIAPWTKIFTTLSSILISSKKCLQFQGMRISSHQKLTWTFPFHNMIHSRLCLESRKLRHHQKCARCQTLHSIPFGRAFSPLILPLTKINKSGLFRIHLKIELH